MLSGQNDPQASDAQTRDRLQAIVESAMDAIITVDDAHRIVTFNPAAEQMFGISAQDALGQSIERFIPHRYRASHGAHIKRFSETGQTARRMGELGAVSALRANGEEFPVEASISQAKAGDEHLSTVILRDITARRANEQAQTLLAREVDHRAKNILAVISSLVSLTRAPTPAAYVESLSGRIAAMSRAHGLLAQQRWQGASLGRIAEEELEAHTEVAQFRCAGPELVLAARAVQPISMLIHELATNAVKYGALSVPNGEVDLSWGPMGMGGIRLHWIERGGPPVTEPQQPGFGSTLIKQIIGNQLGGTIDAQWKPGGFEMIVHLPETVLQGEGERSMASSVSESPPPRRSDAETEADPQGGTILIVEDEPLLAMQLSQSLEEFGWSILGVAGSVEDANRILADKKRPDAAILDVDLGGAPVFPLARSLRRSGIPFLFCTGYEDLEYSREFSNCTAVRKPATVLQIVRALRNVVRSANTQAHIAPAS